MEKGSEYIYICNDHGKGSSLLVAYIGKLFFPCIFFIMPFQCLHGKDVFKQRNDLLKGREGGGGGRGAVPM